MKIDESLYWIYVFLTLLYIVLMFIGSLIPGIGGIGILSHNKVMYFLHFIEFVILGFLLFKVFYFYGSKNPHLMVFSFGIIIAFLTEFVQLFISYRSFNVLDIAADGIGLLVALYLVGLIK